MKLLNYRNYLVNWIQNIVSESHLKGAVFGLSGGADSVVVASLVKKALPNNSLALFFKTPTNLHKQKEVEDLAALLKIDLKIIDLQPVLINAASTFKAYESSLTKSTISRLIMTCTYAVAQELGYMVFGTLDASEITIGDFIKHGSIAADAQPISGLTKTDIQDLMYELGLPKNVCDKMMGNSGKKSSWEEKYGVSVLDVDKWISGKKLSSELQKQLLRLNDVAREAKQTLVWPRKPRSFSSAGLKNYHTFLVQWIQDVVKALGADGVVFGLSGGADSTVVAGLCHEAFPKNSLGVIMPIGSMHEHMTDAKEVATNLNLSLDIIDLSQLFEAIKSTNDLSNKLAIVNIKPRLRMTTLYSIAESKNYVVVGTSNAAEWAIGYFTKYGDGAGDLYPLIHFPKNIVQQLVLDLHLPQRISTKTPTADLWPGQSLKSELGYTYQEVDAYLQNHQLDEQIKSQIAMQHHKTSHKRNPPLMPITFNDFESTN